LSWLLNGYIAFLLKPNLSFRNIPCHFFIAYYHCPPEKLTPTLVPKELIMNELIMEVSELIILITTKDVTFQKHLFEKVLNTHIHLFKIYELLYLILDSGRKVNYCVKSIM
jgi:hypothetical protein